MLRRDGAFGMGDGSSGGRRNAVRRALIVPTHRWRVEPPFEMPSNRLARKLVEQQSLLTLPGTMFAPPAAEGRDWRGERQLRIAFANADAEGIATMRRRLVAFRP